jgi:eukaryotic-like serine/threonine-protein kinase
MQPKTHCPDREKLLALYRGELDAEAVEVVGQHLATCALCEAFLASVQEPEDGIVSNLRKFLNREHWIKREEFQAVEARAMAIPIEHIGFLPASSVAEHDAGATPQEQSPLTRLGKYELLKVLGRGGMGIVYAAVHTKLNKKVAVKIILPQYSQDLRVRARFRREMQAIGELSHANIVAATDADEAAGCHFLVMELVDGLNLDILLRYCGPLPVADACEIIRQAAVGLQYVHEHHRVHRDLKPSNLMLSSEGVVKILDLGLTRLFSDEGPSEELTRSNLMMGTADYMAPEQWEDSRKVDIRADIYSLGCTLYKLLVGEAPFSDPEYRPPAQKKVAHARLPFPDVQSRRSAVPAGVAAVLERMMEKAPARRFATPQEAADALLPFTRGCDCRQLVASAMPRSVEHDHVQATNKGPAADTVGHQRATPADVNQQKPKVARKRRLWTGIGAGAACVAAAAFIALNWPAQQEPPLRPGVWHDVLKREPTKIYWKNSKFDHIINFSPDRSEVYVDTPFMSFLRLGKTDQAGYRIRLGIRQTTWTGGVGLFFGYHPAVINGKSRFKYQLLKLLQPDKQQLILSRVWDSFEQTPEGLVFPPSVDRGLGFASALIDPLRGREESTLAIEVKSDRLSSVTWNGKFLPELVGDKDNAMFTANDYVGDFGLYNYQSSCLYGNAHLLLFERTPQ